MNVCFRADASLAIGSGHVMRCLTLADALRTRGAVCHFLTRAHAGNLISTIRQRGHDVTALPDCGGTVPVKDDSSLAHSAWLGCSIEQDAEQSAVILHTLRPDWLVLDHYALDQRWERALRPYYGRLLAIDDLADRPHDCDILLDQNLGRKAADYAQLLPKRCTIAIGPAYALLRPEFSRFRPYSLNRRAQGRLQRILISMGGVDNPDATSRVLQTLGHSRLPQDCELRVIMGS